MVSYQQSEGPSKPPSPVHRWRLPSALRVVGACAVALTGATAVLRSHRSSESPQLVATTNLDTDELAASDRGWIEQMAGYCNEFDDDALYPSEICFTSDYKSEIEDHMPYLPVYERICNNSYSVYGNASWGIMCAYEAMLNLESVCNGTFTDSMPTASSKNMPPSLEHYPTNRSRSYNEEGHCNTHAFCYECVETDGKVKAPCRTIMSFYGDTLITCPTATFLANLTHWCNNYGFECTASWCDLEGYTGGYTGKYR